MSFAEKIAGLMARPNQPDPVAASDVPWYMKYAGRLLGIVGAFFAILLGLYNAVLSIVTINIGCVMSGILQMLVGFIVMAVEAPCCFICIDYVNKLADKADERPMWNRAAFYCIIALPPILLCFSLSSLFGCGLIIATGAVYGMMALGKKASREDMAAAATSPTQMPPNGGQMQMGTDQHITLMEDPDVWRPT